MKMPMKPRIAITGAGVISALGNSRQEVYQKLLEDECPTRKRPDWADQMYGTYQPFAAAVDLPTETAKTISRHFRRSMGNAALFATLAARDAVAESGLTKEDLQSGRIGCIISSTVGSPSEIYASAMAVLRNELQALSSCQFFKIVSHSSAFNVANYFGICGVQLSPCSACASALQSIGLAYEQIKLGHQDAIVAGGSDETTPIVLESFRFLNALAKNPDWSPCELSRPFAEDRCGLVCGDGAGIFVVEEWSHAQARQATILGEILGYATNCNGAQISQSDGASIAYCMRQALKDANLNPEDIDYVSAHATSTPSGDREEASAIREIFGDTVPVSSLKGHLGHTLGASGGLESAIILEMAKNDTIIPTKNLARIAEDCAGLDHVTFRRQKRLRTVLKNCIAFGGVNATIIYRLADF